MYFVESNKTDEEYITAEKEWEDGQLRLGVREYQTRFYEKNRRHLNKAS